MVIDPGEADHIERPAAFHCSHMGQRKKKNADGSCAPANDLKLYRYHEEAHEIDVRVAYASAAYPHLLSVHRFKQTDAWPQQFDIAPFEMPAGAAAGQYVLHYLWRADLPLKPPDPLKPQHPRLPSLRLPLTPPCAPCRVPHAACPMPCAPCRPRRGYRDCIDIDLLPEELVLPDTSDAKYGYELTGTDDSSWSRTDHCQYEE